MKTDGLDRLQNLSQVVAFCLVIATVQYGFAPDQPYGPPVVYSLLIGCTTWAVIDLGRGLFPSAQTTGWPTGLAGPALVAVGNVTGFAVGVPLADRVCRLYGLYGPDSNAHTLEGLRTAFLITVVAGLAGSFYFYARGKSAFLQRQVAQVQRHADESRLRLLESQLEPHMLFNTLANLRALISTDPARAITMLDRLNNYLRATLQASRSQAGQHTLAMEFDRLRDYLDIMGVRLGPRLRFELTLPPALADHPLPALLLQPLVENAIRHGIEPSVQGGAIHVEAAHQGPVLVLTVGDTGVGSPMGGSDQPPPSTQGTGFGLQQVRDRLDATYGPNATLQWHSQPDQGTQVTLRLPWQAPTRPHP